MFMIAGEITVAGKMDYKTVEHPDEACKMTRAAFEGVVDIPVVAQRESQTNQMVQKIIEIPQLQHSDDVVSVPVVSVVQAPLVRAVMKTVETARVQIVTKPTEIPQLPFAEKIVMIPEIRGPQTSECLSFDSRGLGH